MVLSDVLSFCYYYYCCCVLIPLDTAPANASYWGKWETWLNGISPGGPYAHIGWTQDYRVRFSAYWPFQFFLTGEDCDCDQFIAFMQILLVFLLIFMK